MPRRVLTGLLLASGRGQRFDASGQQNKLLARLPDGRAVLRAAAEHLCAVLERVIVVVPVDADQAQGLRTTLHGLTLEIVNNIQAASGMSTSIAAGVAASTQAAGWIIALADMPYVRPATIALLRDALCAEEESDQLIVAPTYQGQRGHPVGFAAGHAAALLALTGDQGARDLLLRHPVQRIATDDSGILRDIDTPDDLKKNLHV